MDRPLWRIVLLGTLFGIVSDVVGDVVLGGYHYRSLPLNFVLWFLFWLMMAYFLPSEKVWKPLRYMWVGWYAFLFEALSVSTGFLTYNIPVAYRWYVSFASGNTASYIPLAAFQWIIYTGIQIAIAVDLFESLKTRVGGNTAGAVCILLTVFLAVFLTWIYVVVNPLIGW